MKSLALTDKNQQPDDGLLEQVLQQKFTLYQQLRQQLWESEIEIMWNYYNDGKAWLGKLMWRKKNLGWVHVYDQAFRIVVFFTEKYKQGVLELDIPQDIKECFQQTPPSGKLIPLPISVECDKDLAIVRRLMEYKKKCR